MVVEERLVGSTEFEALATRNQMFSHLSFPDPVLTVDSRPPTRPSLNLNGCFAVSERTWHATIPIRASNPEVLSCSGEGMIAARSAAGR